MHVVIAGGSGLIGTELTSALLVAGDKVTILSRNPKKVVRSSPEVIVRQWDVQTIGEWARQVENADAIVNLTGENLSGEGFLPSRWTKERKSRLVQSRVNSGVVLSKAVAMAQSKPRVFVQASGIGYYGTLQQKSLTEADSAGNDFLAKLSLEWEKSSQPVEEMGVRRVVVRNGVVLSTKGGAFPLLLLPFRLFVGGPMGNGRQVYSWIHIADEVAAIQFLLHNDQARGVFNLTAPGPVTNAEFGRTISKVMRRPYYFPVPGFAMKLALGEVAVMVLEGQKVMPQNLLNTGYTFKFPTLLKALTDLLT
jgi:uncharacterized protein (TIGR01777 family)